MSAASGERRQDSQRVQPNVTGDAWDVGACDETEGYRPAFHMVRP
ncbi:hypothetical protein [Paludisphaera mucosa]|uniref:Uncharacterized protein n=1 Tax=Paludisphaera mucosa TaxID=3030827 RepID=A0ABT6FLG7_9BACT|nr:hypothetical protein [Paludisphaera mucosa]MDG3008336.1 hypothetical protein [Paludisphaera mucosa]